MPKGRDQPKRRTSPRSHGAPGLARDELSTGALFRELRIAAGWSQDRLAEQLRAASGHPTVTREDISRWENGRRRPGHFWLCHLACVFQVPLADLEREIVRRREMLKLAGTLAVGAIAPHDRATGTDLYSSIAAGDSGPLAVVQTTHQTDLMLAGLAARERVTMLRLARWMNDDASPVLRVNAAGILAKTRDLDFASTVALQLRHDPGGRDLYLTAVQARAGSRLIAELRNPRDAGARWCAAWLLGHDGGPQARQALVSALYAEPVLENVRTIGMILNGDLSCT